MLVVDIPRVAVDHVLRRPLVEPRQQARIRFGILEQHEVGPRRVRSIREEVEARCPRHDEDRIVRRGVLRDVVRHDVDALRFEAAGEDPSARDRSAPRRCSSDTPSRCADSPSTTTSRAGASAMIIAIAAIADTRPGNHPQPAPRAEQQVREHDERRLQAEQDVRHVGARPRLQQREQPDGGDRQQRMAFMLRRDDRRAAGSATASTPIATSASG